MVWSSTAARSWPTKEKKRKSRSISNLSSQSTLLFTFATTSSILKLCPIYWLTTTDSDSSSWTETVASSPRLLEIRVISSKRLIVDSTKRSSKREAKLRVKNQNLWYFDAKLRFSLSASLHILNFYFWREASLRSAIFELNFLVRRRSAEKARSRWSVGPSICPFANGKETQLRPKSRRNCSQVLHQGRQGLLRWSHSCRFCWF